MAAHEQEHTGNCGRQPLLPGGALPSPAPEQPEVEQQRTAHTTGRDGEQRRYLDDGIPDGKERPAPEEIDGGKRRHEPQPGGGVLRPG
jgi:hypothetical protein